MAVSPVFDLIGSELERRSTLSRIEARGTLRLLLKEAGLEPDGVTTAQMAVVVARLLPKALAKRGVDDADGLCRDLREALSRTSDEPAPKESAYDVFERLGRTWRKKP